MSLDKYGTIIKIVIVGDSGTGKSSLFSRYCKKSFDSKIMPTKGINLFTKTNIINGGKITFQMWDTSGDEKYKLMTSAYYRIPSVIILTYSHDNYQSFLNLGNWINLISRQQIEGIHTLFFIVGTKKDLDNIVTIGEVIKFVLSLSDCWNTIKLASTSSKTGEGISELFSDILIESTGKFNNNHDIIELQYNSHYKPVSCPC